MPKTSTEAIREFLESRCGEWLDAKMITAGVISSGYNTGPMNPGISTGAIRYQLAQMIRVSPFVFEQRRLRTRNSKRHGSMYEWRMKPQPPKPVTLTTWLVSFDKI